MRQHRFSKSTFVFVCLLGLVASRGEIPGKLIRVDPDSRSSELPKETEDDLKLPRVLVIGDSISMNYHDAAKAALAGVANYHRNEGNAASSEHGVRNTELWLGDFREKGFHWDVIQFNHGLHDLKQSYDAKTDSWGEYSVPLATYQANLEKQIAILRKTGARLIWCSTTPVPNHNKGTYARRKGASADFNAAALEVIGRHPDILVTDLHAVVDGSPVFDNWRKQNDVHFYQKAEQEALGKAVAATIRKVLENPSKNLPLPGETFAVEGRPAFLMLPENRDASKPTPWVWYAPTLPNLPGPEEKWMFGKFLAAGIAVAGIDVGESMGNPAGRALFTAFHKELVSNRGMSPKPCLLARSRGGLMLYNWAAENPQSVAAIAGIYPVGNLTSWPGLAKAAPAYGLAEAELADQLHHHNPIERLAPLAKAGIPIMHIHGDNDTVVPLIENSGVIKQRYEQLGGQMILEVIKGGGHDMNAHWFQSETLAAFIIHQLTAPFRWDPAPGKNPD
jgi:pimeloyl-ACP methyl ester carboxylesterase